MPDSKHARIRCPVCRVETVIGETHANTTIHAVCVVCYAKGEIPDDDFDPETNGQTVTLSGPRTPQTPWTTAQRRVIYNLATMGTNAQDIAEMLGVTRQRVHQIANGFAEEHSLPSPKVLRQQARNASKQAAREAARN